MQKTADPSPPTEEEPVEGLYSIAPSRVSSMSRPPCNVSVSFGFAGRWDSGQLTANHSVMGQAVFNHFFSTVMDPYSGVRVDAASGDPLEIIGQIKSAWQFQV